MKRLGIILFLLLINCIYASCDNGQIDINSASEKELDKLIGIGPVKAEAITDYREKDNFDSVDELINVYGIGEATLEKIKNQGLACVDSYDEDDSDEDKEEENFEEPFIENIAENKNVAEKNQEEKPVEIIQLNAKSIKTGNPEEVTDKNRENNYSLYLLGGFCVLLVFLFGIKKLRDKFRENKNEFN